MTIPVARFKIRPAMTIEQLPRDHGTSGPVVAEISNAIVRLVREHFGKGPTQTKTIWSDDVVVTVMRGGFTQAEQTLYRAGRGDVVDQGRRAMQSVYEREMCGAVERLTGRRVEAFLSANHHDPDVIVETFVLAGETTGADGAAAPPDGGTAG
jgi:uncharacterized protein YbcI